MEEKKGWEYADELLSISVTNTVARQTIQKTPRSWNMDVG